MINKEKFKNIFKQKIIFLSLILIIGIFFRFYDLNNLPNDIFGDISQNLEHINSVLTGNWKLIYGYDGRESILFFIASIFAKIFGNTYLTLKITCAIIGTITIVGEYFFVKEIAGTKAGLLAAFFVAVSKWPVTFSRIGFRVVLTPLFVSLVLYFFIKANKTGKLKYFITTGIITGVGLYPYPAFRFMIITIGLLSLVNIIRKKFVQNHLILIASVFMLCMPMIMDYFHNPIQYSSHINQMFLTENNRIRDDWLLIFIQNIKNQMLMFIKGDIVFRVNPPLQPLLDLLSSILFIIGIVFYSISRKNKNKSFIFLPLFLLQLPSVLVLNNPIDIPSATRTLISIPIIFMFSAIGLNFVYTLLGKSKKNFTILFLIIILGSIALTNWHNYFNLYRYNLPNHNVSFAKIIANEIDKLPNDVEAIMIDQGWGEWAQPECMGVFYFLKKPKNIIFLEKNDLQKVTNINKKYLICSPEDSFFVKNFFKKENFTETKFVDEYKQSVFTALKNF